MLGYPHRENSFSQKLLRTTKVPPPHPDLKVQDVKEMVEWIVKYNADPGLTYSVGTDGALRTREKPANASAAEVYVSRQAIAQIEACAFIKLEGVHP